MGNTSRKWARHGGKPKKNIKHQITNIKEIKPQFIEDKSPLSIIISAYEAQEFVKECLDSIENQTYFKNFNNYEILIGVDNCEETLKKLKEIRNSYRNLRIFMMDSNRGTYITSNTLLDIIKYENVLRFDADDIMRPHMVETLMREENLEYDAVRYNCQNFNLKTTTSLVFGSFLFKKDIFKLFGGWQNWVCSADYEFFERVDQHITIKILDDILFDRRVHINSLTRKKETNSNSLIRKECNDIVKYTDYSKILYINREISQYKEIKRNICFIYDIKGWAFYNMAHEIKKNLTDFYDIDIIRFDNLKSQNDYDVIITFSPRVKPKNIKHYKNIICGISSHFGDYNKDTKNHHHIFTNDIGIFNTLINNNKHYTPNGINTKFFKNVKIRNKENKIWNIGAIGSIDRLEHKGKFRLDVICEKLNNEGFNINNLSLFVKPGECLTQSEMKNFYSDLDILIISSLSETGPNTLLEAMASGIPVVSNDVGLVNELVVNGITGYLISSYDNINEYVGAIKNIIENSEIYDSMSINCLQSIKKFDWKEKSLPFKKMIDMFTYKK